MTQLLIIPIRIYQWTLSPLIRFLSIGKACCRFEPSCSHYAIEAIQVHGAWKGSSLTLKRLLKCQPWGSCGWDPVPPRQS